MRHHNYILHVFIIYIIYISCIHGVHVIIVGIIMKRFGSTHIYGIDTVSMKPISSHAINSNSSTEQEIKLLLLALDLWVP